MSLDIDIVVAGIRDLAVGVRELSFTRVDGGEFPPHSAGSHVRFAVDLGESVHCGPYSLVGDPARRDEWRIAVQRRNPSRGGSAWLCDEARPGSRLQAGAPVNAFPLVQGASHHLLVAGGIGIAPMLPMALELARAGASFELHYAFRRRGTAVLLAEIHEAAGARVVEHESAGGRRIEWRPLLAAQPCGTHLYLCGPAEMAAECMAVADALGWPPARLHGPFPGLRQTLDPRVVDRRSPAIGWAGA